MRIHPVAAWAALGFASLGVLLGGAELMVVAIALPSIVADFGGWADLGRVSWIVNAYLLAYVVAMPLAGRGADLWGALRLYVVALLLFVIGSAGAGLSAMAGPEDGLTWLIVARVVQGFGGGALVPLSMALASHLFSGRARGIALGVEGAATYIGMAIGPAYGAWVLLNFSLPIRGLEIAPWQWIFLLNVPIGIVTLLLIYVFAGGVETPRVPGRLDLVGRGAADRRARGRHRCDHRVRRDRLDRSARHRRPPAGASSPEPSSSGTSCERAGRSSTCASSPIGRSRPPTSSAC